MPAAGLPFDPKIEDPDDDNGNLSKTAWRSALAAHIGHDCRNDVPTSTKI